MSYLKKIIIKIFGWFKNTEQLSLESFSQCGEDLIVNFVFQAMQVHQPTYLDIGAHHPIKYSNTNFFYKMGSRGVSVEPNSDLYKLHVKHRRHDVSLNCGIGAQDAGQINFYLMSNSTLNTFSESEAKRYEEFGTYKIQNIVKIPVVGINTILEQYFPEASPDFVTIDVEGLDFSIISAIDFNRWRPKVFCIETLTYSETRQEKKNMEVIEFLISKDYFVYGDTYINTIFVDKKSWVG